jgi:hypothetical protein
VARSVCGRREGGREREKDGGKRRRQDLQGARGRGVHVLGMHRAALYAMPTVRTSEGHIHIDRQRTSEGHRHIDRHRNTHALTHSLSLSLSHTHTHKHTVFLRQRTMKNWSVKTFPDPWA